MSIYTTADRDAVKSAIIDLATGKRVVQTDIGGKVREFHRVDLEKLRNLLSSIQADLETGGSWNKARFDDPI
jgi:hypothetical protein